MSDDLAELTDLWPPNSPDLNPTDYKIWNIIQQRVYQTKVQDADHLSQRQIDVLAEMEESVIDDAIDQWRSRSLHASI